MGAIVGMAQHSLHDGLGLTAGYARRLGTQPLWTAVVALVVLLMPDTAINTARTRGSNAGIHAGGSTITDPGSIDSTIACFCSGSSAA